MMAHIILYKDEMKSCIWQNYCKIAGVNPDNDSLILFFDKKLTVAE